MSVEDGLWQASLENITEKLKKINLPHQLANVPTFQGKVAKALENYTIRNKIATYISQCNEVHHYKSGATASRLRDQGNQKFMSKDNCGALKLYTESIICAPELGPELSLAYGNRSAALFHTGDFLAALKDVEMALKHKYPKNTEYKILQRQAQCLVRLARYAEALQVLNNCETAMNAARLSEDKVARVLREVNAMKQELQGLLKRQASEEKKESIHHFPDFENSGLPGASPKLILLNSEEKVRGRYVTTAEDILQGEVLFSETPYSSTLLPEQYSSNCHHCYRKFSAPQPCKKCTQPRYCSLECVEEGWEYHQYECGQLDLLHSVGIGHLAVRTVLVAGMSKLQSIRNSVKGGCYENSNTDGYSRVYSLLHHIDKMQEDEVFQYTVTAALLTTFLAKKTTFIFPNKPGVKQPDSDLKDDLVNYVGGLILRHLCQLVGNAHAITEMRESESGDIQQVRLAAAIYTSASMMNHSCVPTIINQFIGRRLVVRATRELQAGDEVTNCYGPQYRRHTYPDRQEMLLSQYKFRCQCKACADIKERNFLKRFKGTKCNYCQGPVIDNLCNDCDRTVDSSSNYEEEIDGIVSELLGLELEEGRAQLERLAECERRMEGVLYTHNSQLARVRDMLARALADAGDYRQAARVSRLSLATTMERFGPSSIEAGHELLKYTDLLLAQLNSGSQIDTEELRKSLQQALEIFALNYGEACKYCIELNQKLSMLQTSQ